MYFLYLKLFFKTNAFVSKSFFDNNSLSPLFNSSKILSLFLNVSFLNNSGYSFKIAFNERKNTLLFTNLWTSSLNVLSDNLSENNSKKLKSEPIDDITKFFHSNCTFNFIPFYCF